MSNSETNNRDVSKKEISKTFRGVLRISPDNEGGDVGLDETFKSVSDSVGNESPLALSKDSVFVKKEIVSNTQLRDKITFGMTSNVPVDAPGNEDILIGTLDGNYTQVNLREFLDNYFRSNFILEQLVPVGTIIYHAMYTEDLTLLPAKYQGWWDFCKGQSFSTINYPDLAKLLNVTGPTFNIPDLRNKFIRSSSSQSNWSNYEGGYNIPAHNPLTIEYPQTNLFLSRVITGNIVGTFKALFNAGRDNPPQPLTSGCFRQLSTGVIGNAREKAGAASFQEVGLDLSNTFSQSDTNPKETRPYNITLVPLIKVK